MSDLVTGIVRDFSQKFKKTPRELYSAISHLLPVRASNTRGRASSSNNAIAKDWACIGAEKWTDEDENMRRSIFRGILFSGKCDYCGNQLLKENRERDHFIPSSSRMNSMYGADHIGNKFNVCRGCNQYKKSYHPTCIIQKMHNDGDVRRAFAFQRFLELFEHKLILPKEIVACIQKYQRKMDTMTKRFCEEMEREMKKKIT